MSEGTGCKADRPWDRAVCVVAPRSRCYKGPEVPVCRAQSSSKDLRFWPGRPRVTAGEGRDSLHLKKPRGGAVSWEEANFRSRLQQ